MMSIHAIAFFQYVVLLYECDEGETWVATGDFLEVGHAQYTGLDHAGTEALGRSMDVRVSVIWQAVADALVGTSHRVCRCMHMLDASHHVVCALP